ncbi:MAG: DNA methyltransferase, partial [Brevundimonas sp.]
AVRQGRTSDEDANIFRGGAYTGGDIDNGATGKRKVRGNKQIAAAESAARAGGSSGRRMAGFNERWDAKERARREAQYQKPYTGTALKDYAAQGLQDPSEIKRRIVEGKMNGTIADGRNLRNYEPAPVQVWPIATRPFSDAHFATFPPELAERCLLAGCPKGGSVLDPFGGAGTTGLVADRLGLDCTLIELNPEYAEIARRRIARDQGMFAAISVASNDQTGSEAASLLHHSDSEAA